MLLQWPFCSCSPFGGLQDRAISGRSGDRAYPRHLHCARTSLRLGLGAGVRYLAVYLLLTYILSVP